MAVNDCDDICDCVRGTMGDEEFYQKALITLCAIKTNTSGGGGGATDQNLIQVSGTPISLGQKTMVASLPVVISSNQSAVPISSTALTSIDTKLPAQGQALAAASIPVVLTAIQAAALTPPAIVGGAPVSGQKKVAVTGTALAIAGSNALTQGVTIKANVGNAAPIVVGPSGVNNTTDGTGTGFILYPGDAISISVSNTNLIFINGTAADWISFIGN